MQQVDAVAPEAAAQHAAEGEEDGAERRNIASRERMADAEKTRMIAEVWAEVR